LIYSFFGTLPKKRITKDWSATCIPFSISLCYTDTDKKIPYTYSNLSSYFIYYKSKKDKQDTYMKIVCLLSLTTLNQYSLKSKYDCKCIEEKSIIIITQYWSRKKEGV
jgi:hypothetical protein